MRFAARGPDALCVLRIALVALARPLLVPCLLACDLFGAHVDTVVTFDPRARLPRALHHRATTVWPHGGLPHVGVGCTAVGRRVLYRHDNHAAPDFDADGLVRRDADGLVRRDADCLHAATGRTISAATITSAASRRSCRSMIFLALP